jgi:ER membrane protein complex subunit 7
MIILLILALADAGTISGEIFPPKSPADRKAWSASRIKLSLSGQRTAYLDASSSFSFHNVPDGVYLLETLDSVFFYKPVIIEVVGENVQARDPNSFKNDRIIHPLRIQAEHSINYFEQREPFSILSILMNPMVLMTVVMLGMAFFMPKMQMDPDQMKEMKEMQKQMSSGWMSSFLNPPS